MLVMNKIVLIVFGLFFVASLANAFPDNPQDWCVTSPPSFKPGCTVYVAWDRAYSREVIRQFTFDKPKEHPELIPYSLDYLLHEGNR